jgi:hypothetical protein
MHQIYLGILSRIRQVIDEYQRMKPVFDMVKQMVYLLKLDQVYIDTLRDMEMNHTISQARDSLIDINETVWARKNAADKWSQPPYMIPERATILGGVNIKAVIHLADKLGSPWLAKIGLPSNHGLPLVADGVSEESRPRADVASTAVREHAAAYLYECLNNLGATYRVAKFRLAELPIINVQTRRHALTEYLEHLINHTRHASIENAVYLLSKMVPGYRDLCELDRCIIAVNGEDQIFSFKECLMKGLLPDEAEITDDVGGTRIVPLCGLIELLATSRLLADTDVLGGSASNAGYCYERGIDGEIKAVRVIKVDPGESFSFSSPFNQFFKLDRKKEPKEDPRFIQYANQQPPLLWSSLTKSQQERFEHSLKSGLKILKDMIAVNNETEEISLQGITDNELYRRTSAGKSISSIEPILRRFLDYLNSVEQVYFAKTKQSNVYHNSINSSARLKPQGAAVEGSEAKDHKKMGI